MLRRIGVTVSSNNLFQHAYAKIEFVENELCVARRTASQYLKQLVSRLAHIDFIRSRNARASVVRRERISVLTDAHWPVPTTGRVGPSLAKDYTDNF